ncbi:transcriptional regulator [Serratia fonticola]|uniref:winged helix-turn-helix domain-containing protein n=1 Tax=Serratia fonticola TaxID=47917 RepID=UPI000BFD619D|nr:transcriptional regulator [Serratia fonticola]ATM74963.1 transcriptional regulator [Serratia fonticola]
MKKKFLINKSVYFIPDEHRLEPIGGSGVGTTLNIPVSRCLLLLLQRNNDIINQREFIYDVWESKGQFANINTYFQNIYLLRKALKISGINENVIKTVPKEGLQFIGTVSLVDDPEHSPESRSESIETGTETEITDEINISPEQTSAPLSSEQQEIQSSQPVSSKKTMHVFLNYKIIFLFIIFSVFLFLSIQLYMGKAQKSDFFLNYNIIGKVNQCTVYASNSSVLRQHQDYIGFLENKNISCNPEQVVYIDMNNTETRVIIHICDKTINEIESCLSKLYIEKKDEN